MAALTKEQIHEAHEKVYEAVRNSKEKGVSLSQILVIINKALNLEGTEDELQSWEDIEPRAKRGLILVGTKGHQSADGEKRYFLHAHHPEGRVKKSQDKAEKPSGKTREKKAEIPKTAEIGLSFYFELNDVSFQTLELPISQATATRVIISSEAPGKMPKRIGQGFTSMDITFITLRAKTAKGKFGNITIEAERFNWGGKVGWALIEF